MSAALESTVCSLRTDARKSMHRDKDAWQDGVIARIESACRSGEWRQAFRLPKLPMPREPRALPGIRDESGILLSDPDKVALCWNRHWA
eukprot:7991987-Alexandrium_andersonii.AAC.1